MKVHNKIGFHTGPGGNATGIGDYFRALDTARIPFMIKSVDSYGPVFEAGQLARKSGVPHILVYRISTAGQGHVYDFDVPPYKDPKYAKDPEGGAALHWRRTREKIPPEFDKELTWIEPINEVDKDYCDWLGRFAVHIANLAHAEGYKVSLFAWSSGEPEPAGWEEPGMLDYLRLCAQRPSQAAVALHEYSYTVDDIMDGYPYKIGRFKALFDVCDKHGIARPTVHITEWGWTLNNVPPPEKAMPDIEKIGELYARYPEIKGAAIWYLGPGFGDIANKAQRLIAPVKEFTLRHQFEVELDKPEKATGKPDVPRPTQPPLPPAPEVRPPSPVNPPPPVVVVEPPPPAQPAAQQSNAAFVADITIPDDMPMAPGTTFVKTWRVKNTGTRVWGAGFTLAFIKGDAMGSQTSYPLPAIAPGATGDVSIKQTAPTTPGVHFGDWRMKDDQGNFFGEVIYLRIQVKPGTPAPTPKPTPTPRREPPPAPTPAAPALQTGMNINPDAPHSNPLESGELRGMDWVRWVFKLAARLNPAERQDINAAFRQYDLLVQGYLDQGVRSLIILNQETVWGNAPWSGNNDWNSYANHLADVARQIAARYKKYGAAVAYQIWNEGDLENNPASVYVPPAQFAIVLKRVAEAVRAESPQSPLIFGGMATGPHKTIPYLKACKQALNGPWPVDAIGIHPYGRWGTKAPFDWGQTFGTLGQAFAEYERELPGLKFWVTEIGVAADNEIGPQHYQDIGMYIQDVYSTIAARYTNLVPVVIWFAWSDLMRNAGIVDGSGRRKSSVYAAFENIRSRKF